MTFHSPLRSFHNGANVVTLPQKIRAEYPGTSDPNDLRNPVTQQNIMRRLNREWRAHLTLAERDLLFFILDQTSNWSRPERVFSYRFIESGDNLTVGTELSERQARRTVTSLEAKGAIAIDRTDTTKGLLIRPNFDWNPEVSMLSVPKRLEEGNKTASRTSGMQENQQDGWNTPDENVRPPRTEVSALPGRKCRPIKEELFQEEYSEEPFPDRCRDAGVVEGKSPLAVSVRKRVRPSSPAREENPPIAPAPPSVETTAESLLAQAGSTSRPDKASLKPGAIEQTFRRAFEQAYADRPGSICPPWSPRHYANIKKVLVPTWMGKPEALHEFVAWTVYEWDYLVANIFGWMTKLSGVSTDGTKLA